MSKEDLYSTAKIIREVTDLINTLDEDWGDLKATAKKLASKILNEWSADLRKNKLKSDVKAAILLEAFAKVLE